MMESEDRSLALRCDAAGSNGGAAPPRKPRKKRVPLPAAPASALPAPGEPDASVPAQASPIAPAATPDVPAIAPGEVHQRLGHLTRTLHDALRELGYDKELQGTRDQLPDARDRLTYIARVTGEAAEKVLNAVDRARSVQEQMTATANDLRTRWLAVAAYAARDAARTTPAGRELIEQTCAFFAGVDSHTEATKAILTDIMLAQDFHDLTGQVIRKVVTLAQSMEEQLLKLLLETTPPEQRKKVETQAPVGSTERLDGPVVNAAARSDVVTDQAGVDDLLASLGF
jgi:chemotaxis protein CheZ